MMSTTLDDMEKPISPKRAAAELEEVLSKSLFLSTPEDSDFDGSTSLNDSDMSRDSAFDWHPAPERFRLAPRPSSRPTVRRQLERSHSSTSTSSLEEVHHTAAVPRPTMATRSKSLGAATASEVVQRDIRAKSLIDDDSGTDAASSAVASSASGGDDALAVAAAKRRFTFISNIGEVTKVDHNLDAKSVGSRKSRRSRQSRQSRKSVRSTKSRKRGDSLERDISLTILQTAEKGADSAHFLVNSAPVVKSPVKSPEEILGDLFVSQDTSLEPISLDEHSNEFGTPFFTETVKPSHDSPISKPLFTESEFSPTSELSPQSPATEAALIATKNSKDSGSIFTFTPKDEGDNDQDSEEDQGPSYAKNYIDGTHSDKNNVSAIISESPSEDSLFAFSDSEVTQDTDRGKELLFPEDSLKEEVPIGSRCAPTTSNKVTQKKAPRLAIPPRPQHEAVHHHQDVLRTSSSAEKSADRYKIEMESSTGASSIGAPRSYVSASDGACEVQQALAAVSSPVASEKEYEVNLEREDSFTQEEKVAQEEHFLDKLVDIVQVARERPRDVQLSEFYKSSSGETDDASESTVEYPEDESPTQSVDARNPLGVESDEKLTEEAHPDPELDDFLEEHGFGESSDEEDNELQQELGEDDDDDDEWTAFDSPFGASRFANDEASGSTAPPPEDGSNAHQPESPTSVSDFSSNPTAREKAKIIWWNREKPDDSDMLSV